MGKKLLVKHDVHIDLPGEPVCVASHTDTTITLRKHRDVVFDVKLHAGSTYTVTTTHPDQPNGRFYDAKRKLNVAKTTFKDGEPCHVWVGRNFEGSLILKQGEKELGRYAISKMDCTKGCTEDPKDKPAPMLIVMHDNQVLAKDLRSLGEVPQDSQHPASSIPSSAQGAGQSGHSGSSVGVRSGNATQVASAPVPLSEAKATRSRNGMPTVHAFKIKQTTGSTVPPELVEFFASGADAYTWDPLSTISRNFLIAQVAGGLGYGWDVFGPKGPLKGFWNRVFSIHRNSNGEFTIFFQTSRKERDLLGFLLTTYRAHSRDVRVMTLVGGAGSLSAGSRATWEAGKASVNVRTMTGKALGLTIVMDTVAWWKDFQTIKSDGTRKKDFVNLLVTIGIDVFQMWATTLVSTAFLSAMFTTAAATAAGAVTAPVWAIAIGAVVIVWAVGYLVAAPFNQKDKADKTFGDNFAEWLRRTGELLEKKLPRDYPDTYSKSTWPVFPMGATP
ncbi:hypothetical protein [Burkholderia ubonensis]|uniref:hypothetical protein n=1 Tax=Burkholderia ubonensis TaxID=101571 RepID=UPI00016A6727|nr:hypothetical protein [Burkholderia ubonensis]